MSHEELLQREDAVRRRTHGDARPADAPDVTPVTPAAVLLLDPAQASEADGPEPGDAAAQPPPRRARRLALAAAATALITLVTAATVHEVTVRRQRAALEGTHLTMEDARVDLRPLLYARLAGSRLTANVPVRMRVVNPGDGPVRVIALQVGGVSVSPVEDALVPAGGRATLTALARMTCDDVPPRAAPGLSVLPDGQAAALLADTHGHRRAVTLATWPALEQRLPTAAPCDRFSWAPSAPGA